MNKHILLVMKWLDDKDSVSQDELVENRKSAFAAYAASAASAAYAEEWVNKYFSRTGENKQEYIYAIAKGKKEEVRPLATEDKEWDGKGLPPVGCECEFNYGPDHERNHWHKVKIVAITDRFFIYTQEGLVEEEVDQIESVTFRPLKTQEEKDREAFAELLLSHYNGGETFLDMADSMINAGFTAPKEGK